MAVRGRPRKHRIRIPTTNEPLLYEMGSVWNHYLNSVAPDTSKTRQQYFGYFTRWLSKEIKQRSLLEIDAAYILLCQTQRDAILLVESYKRHMISKELAPGTINTRLGILTALVKTARWLGLVNFELAIKRMRIEHEKKIEGPEIHQIRTVLKDLNLIIQGTHPNRQKRTILAKNKAIRDKAIISMFYTMGLRPKEVAPLTLGHLDLERGRVSILGKCRDERETLDMPREAVTAVNRWLDVRGRRKGHLFVKNQYFQVKKPDLSPIAKSYYAELMQSLGREFGIDMNCRGLRHTAVTEVMIEIQKKGRPIEEGLNFSRHKSIKELLFYRDRIENRQGEYAAIAAQPLSDLFN